jgi:lipopolysaccharide/colanic/teichoic acid biosynthesis glycosyltransferase
MEYKPKLIYIDISEPRYLQVKTKVGHIFEVLHAQNAIEVSLFAENSNSIIAFLSYGTANHPNGIQLRQLINSSPEISYIPFILICDHVTQDDIQKCLQNGINDCFDLDFNAEKLIERVNFLSKTLKNNIATEKLIVRSYSIPWYKRLFDIAVSFTALLLLSPLFIVVIILIKLDSRGPIFYISKRAGTGFGLFDFYKFRSMAINADKKISSLSHLNQYASADSTKKEDGDKTFSYCEDCLNTKSECKNPLYFDKLIVCEKNYFNGNSNNGTFLKIQNDPRVTKLGKFLRNSSIDELPQLFNVLKGNMSIVGNRPLPLYEAEKLTNDQFALRFIAPAGITGLWQVTKRGKSGVMSQEERIQLDNDYAANCSFRKDIIIILKTIPALLQKENV